MQRLLDALRLEKCGKEDYESLIAISKQTCTNNEETQEIWDAFFQPILDVVLSAVELGSSVGY